MHIEQLELKNYRNYADLKVSFEHKINVIIGENAQGKTNLMEAIYVLAFTRSYRTPRERECILWGEEFSRIKGTLHKRERTFPLEIILSKKGKKAKINHLEQQRLSDYIGSMNVVMFAPEDLTLVKGPPQVRRRFIDMELGQMQPSYIYHLSQYQKLLKQRNHLLKKLQRNQKTDPILLDVLTEQLITHAATILERRFAFIEKLNASAQPIHQDISRGIEQLQLNYQATIDISEDASLEDITRQFEKEFGHMKEKEIDRGTTLIGPHRDDLHFYINDRDVQVYGSQGQQRTTALSVKLAEIELIKQEIGEYPILLLDDVLSELDDYRQSLLLSTIQGKVQTFVTTTSVDGIHHETLEQAAIYEVHQGTLIME